MNKFINTIEARQRCRDLILAGTVSERQNEVRRLLDVYPAHDVRLRPRLWGLADIETDNKISLDLQQILSGTDDDPGAVAEVYFHELSHVILTSRGIHTHGPEFAAEAMAITQRMTQRPPSQHFQRYNLAADGYEPTAADHSAIKQRFSYIRTTRENPNPADME